MIFAILFILAYSVVAFIIPNIYWLIGFSAFNLLLCFIFRTGFVRTLKNLLHISVFALIIFLFNLIFDDAISSLIVAWRLVIVANFAFIFAKAFSPAMIATGISQLLFPLKLFKVDTNSLSLMIVIALEFIPILSVSAKNLRQTLKVRGFKFNLPNLFKQGHVVFTLFFSELFKRVDYIENSLRVRGFH